MPFNSLQFIFIFLPLALVGYWTLARFKGRSVASGWLLLMSVVFYAYTSVASLAIIVPSILFDYAIARAILGLSASKERWGAVLFVVGIIANVVLLGYFKYKNFFLDTANTLFVTDFELAKVILPLGISFLTFQKIAFLADVQSGKVNSVRIADFLLFTFFFPRTIAGPIVHYNEVMPQFDNVELRSMTTNVAVGVALFSMGLFKKTVIADGIAQFVPPAFDAALTDAPSGSITAWTSVLAYTFQLYFDFSGYSDMALGTARMFGVRLPMNFNSPLKATSIVEFWSRWHISLTRFLTDYIYSPIVMHLARARMAKGKPVLRGKRSQLSAIAVLVGWPTLITMAISGLWHGAGWQFVVWGLLHGIYLTINQTWRIFRPRFWPDHVSYERVMKPVGFVLTLGAVAITLVFFRAPSIESAFSILRSMLGLNGTLHTIFLPLQSLGISLPEGLVELVHPAASRLWVIALCLATTLLPNSLELLSRFQPALDFPRTNSKVSRHELTSSVKPPAPVERRGISSALANWGATWSAFADIRRNGIFLSRGTAIIFGLLFIFGIMTLSRGGAFIYYGF